MIKKEKYAKMVIPITFKYFKISEPSVRKICILYMEDTAPIAPPSPPPININIIGNNAKAYWCQGSFSTMVCLIPLISSEGIKSGKEGLGYILYNSPDSEKIRNGFPWSDDLSNNSPSFHNLDFPVQMEVSISKDELGNWGNVNSCLINLVCLFANNYHLDIAFCDTLISTLYTIVQKRFLSLILLKRLLRILPMPRNLRSPDLEFCSNVYLLF